METLDRSMEAFRAALKGRGLSETRQRLAIGRAIFAARSHFSADELYDRLRKRGLGVGRVTVYRTLKEMVEAGLVEERPFRKDRVMYEPMFGQKHHDHMVCVSCHAIIEFESPEIERHQDRVAGRHGFRVLHHSHLLFGHCRKCRIE